LRKILDDVRRQKKNGKPSTDLDVIASVVVTAFSKEPMSHYLVGIEFVKDRVGVLWEYKLGCARGEEGTGTYLAEASGENDDFVDFTHLF